MTDLRDEIEQAYASATTQSQEPDNKVDVSEDTAKQEPAQAPVEEVITAPNSYKQEYKDSFSSLPHDWQKYLATREKEMEQGLSRARNEYNWVNNIYNPRKDALAAQGYNNAQEYFETLVGIADALEKNPAATISQLQSIYGSNNDNPSQIEQQINSLAQSQQEMKNYITAVQNERIVNEWNSFVNAKDEAGNPKHPYLEDVKDEMKALFNAGLAKNYDDAYNRAIWQVESVRNKMLAEKNKADLAQKASEAQKVKAAAFNPSSKADGEVKELDLREEIARNFDKFNGE
jgi:hypothetical protein